MIRLRATACAVLLLAGCGRGLGDLDGQGVRACELVADEPVTEGAGRLSLGQTQSGEVVAAPGNGGRLLWRTPAGWVEEPGVPVGSGGVELSVAPSGRLALLVNAYSEVVLWLREPGADWARAVVFDEHDDMGQRALQFAGDGTLFVTVRRRDQEPELYRVDAGTYALERLSSSAEGARSTLWAASPTSFWWAYWGEDIHVRRAGSEAVRIPVSRPGPAYASLTAARGLGVLDWTDATSVELRPGQWSVPLPRAPSRRSECPSYERFDEEREGELCPIDDQGYWVLHVGGDALDLVGTEATEVGVAEWRCFLDHHGGSCDWARETEKRRFLVAARGDGSFERLLELHDAGGYLHHTFVRGLDGDLHGLVSTQATSGAPTKVRYVRIACRDGE